MLEIVVSDRQAELTTRLIQAAQTDPAWWEAQLREAQPGEPLPYDPRCGLSEAEYKEFLTLRPSFRKAGEATLEVTANGARRLAFAVVDGGKQTDWIAGYEIDLEQDVVRTPWALLANRSESHIDSGAVLGPWDGVRWNYDQVAEDGKSGTVASLTLGRIRASGRCMLEVTVQHLGEQTFNLRQTLLYDPPSPSAADREGALGPP